MMRLLAIFLLSVAHSALSNIVMQTLDGNVTLGDSVMSCSPILQAAVEGTDLTDLPVIIVGATVELTQESLRAVEEWCNQDHVAIVDIPLLQTISGVRAERIRSVFEEEFFSTRSLTDLDGVMKAALYFDISSLLQQSGQELSHYIRTAPTPKSLGASFGWTDNQTAHISNLRTKNPWNIHRLVRRTHSGPAALPPPVKPLFTLTEQWLTVLPYLYESDLIKAADANYFLDALIQSYWNPGGKSGIVQRRKLHSLRIYPGFATQRCRVINPDAWVESIADTKQIDTRAEAIAGGRILPLESAGTQVTVEVRIEHARDAWPECWFTIVRNLLPDSDAVRPFAKFVQLGLAGMVFRETSLFFTTSGPGPLLNSSMFGGPFAAEYCAISYTHPAHADNQTALVETLARGVVFQHLLGPAVPPHLPFWDNGGAVQETTELPLTTSSEPSSEPCLYVPSRGN